MHKADRDTVRNFVALVADFCLFSTGLAFYDPYVVVPTFVKEFTGSGLLVGVLAALRMLTITLPQVWAASVLVAQPRKKPLLVWSSLGGRIPVLVLAIATLFWTSRAPGLVIGVLASSAVFFYTSEGLNSISWPAIVGKVIPGSVRGRFFGLGQLLSSVGALGAGYAVRLILGEGTPFDPSRWAALFACAFGGFMLSLASILCVREEAESREPSRISVSRSLRAMAGFLRADGRLRRVVAAQLVLGTSAATYPFFVVRAREIMSGGDQAIGLFLMSQSLGGVIAALVCGQLIDRVGSWAAIRLVAGAQGAALLTVVLGGHLGNPMVFFLVAFFLLGFVTGSSWWSFSAYLLDTADEERRPIYLATSGILTSPTSLSPVLVGALSQVVHPDLLFTSALAISVLGAALAWRLNKADARLRVPETAGVP